jgi:RNA polymerase sigma-70 factor (sigma-E family)
VRAGDEQFVDLYETHRERLFRLAFLVCGDRSRAEDAVAEAFVRVLSKWRSGSVTNPASYLRRAVVNEVVRGFRRRAVERRVGGLRGRNERAGRDLQADLGEQDFVWAALSQLSAPQRAAIVLRFYEDLGEMETAEVLGVSAGTVKSRVSRGLARLRVLLVEEQVDARD